MDRIKGISRVVAPMAGNSSNLVIPLTNKKKEKREEKGLS